MEEEEEHEEDDLDYADENEDEEEPIEPVRQCTYSKCNKGCFHEESLWMHTSLRDAFCAPRVYAILPTLREFQSILP